MPSRQHWSFKILRSCMAVLIASILLSNLSLAQPGSDSKLEPNKTEALLSIKRTISIGVEQKNGRSFGRQ